MSESNERDAERLDQAIERQRAGASEQIDAAGSGAELAPLLNLAAQLDRELPPDLPDPGFREQLKHQLLAPVPVNRRGRRFFYDWRFGVAAAALLVVALIIGIFGSGAFSGDDNVPPARETVASALNVAGSGTEQAGASATPRTVEDTAVFPPIDQDHVVQIPGAASTPVADGTPESQPSPGIVSQTTLPTLPQPAMTWLLTGPDSTQQFLETLIARTGISGQIKPSSTDGPDSFVVVDSTGFAAIHWNQRDAYFRYDRGPNEPTPPAIRATTNPLITAKDWLSEIGFDLTSIKYAESVQSSTGQTIIRFDPSELPATALPPGLGVTVGVGPNGSILFAEGFWLSLSEAAEVHLRDSQQTLAAANQGEWFSPTIPTSTSVAFTVNSTKLSYLLTRADDSSFLLQPVMAFTGERWTSKGKVPDTIFVSTIQK
ncbi:MAG TPA: hypothetical protein VHV31_00495 [Nitrolancea sp.]|jgi:hypothetical protein|nr:hypothetical protein [Nitrolancea sp.]